MGAGERSGAPLLEAKNLSVFMRLPGDCGEIQIVRDIGLSLAPGEIHALVGESGSGKTVSSLAIIGLLDAKRSRVEGSVRLGSRELVGLAERDFARVRGSEIAMIFQEPRKYLNPSRKVGSQLIETVRLHARSDGKIRKDEAARRARKLLEEVGLDDPSRVMGAYPHELSGGMCQRVMIAQALAGNPVVLIADEPTTALDANRRADIEELIRERAKQRNIAVLFISHDLRSVARVADTVSVMYAGRIVERLDGKDFRDRPRHPYTRLLHLAIPDAASRGAALQDIPGTVPEPAAIPDGCAFHDRCPWRSDECGKRIPILAETKNGGAAACHRMEDLWQYW